eukprot:UN29690
MDSLKKTLRILSHDAMITSTCFSFDNQILTSGSNDGVLFTTKIDFKGALSAYEGKATNKTIEVDTALDSTSIKAEELPKEVDDVVKDIKDSTKEYSFEQAKLKMKDDLAKKKAQSKKEYFVAELSNIRKQYQGLIKRNNTLEKASQLDRKDFNLDPNLYKQHNQEKRKQIEQVRLEMQYELEKHSVGLQKLEERFFKDVVVDNITVSALNNKMTVDTFRTLELEKWVQNELNATREARRLAEDEKKELEFEEAENSRDPSVIGASSSKVSEISARMSPKSAKHHKTQQRRMIRLHLKNRIAELEKNKPSENED